MTRSAIRPLLPIMGVVFVAYLMIGIAMPVLPSYVHQRLGLGPDTVGFVAGAPFAAALIVRMWAGHFADRSGSKSAVTIGLSIAVIAGSFYSFSLRFVERPLTSLAVLIVGRVLLGVAESFIITGALSWGLGLMGAQNTGKVMSWVGTALYAALAIGAPAGAALYGGFGFASVTFATMLVPLVALGLVAWLPAVAVAAPKARPALGRVAAAVWAPGIGVALSGVGFGAITTFIVLLFAARGWGFAWLAFSLLGAAFIAGRVGFGHLPDCIGGAKVALNCILVEAVGQALIWLAPTSTVAFFGIVLTGLGYSLVYPAFGVEAIRKAPPESRALAMGAYTAYLDLSLGLAGPALGLVASGAQIGAVFLASTLVVLSAALVAIRLLSRCSPTLASTAH